MAEITKPELSQLYYASLFSPVKQTIVQAIMKGYFATWTNLKSERINKHLPISMATAKGHMHQTRKNLNSTKTQEPKTTEQQPMKPLVQHTNTVFTNIIYHKGKIATDLTGKFPVTLNRGNKYLFVYMIMISITYSSAQ